MESEQSELLPFFAERSTAIARAEAHAREQMEWQRFTSCNHLPHPESDSAFNTYELRAKESLDLDLQHALHGCEDDLSLLHELSSRYRRFTACNGAHAASPRPQQQQIQLNEFHPQQVDSEDRMHEYRSRLRQLMAARIDRATAHMLQHYEKYANNRGDVQVICCTEHFRTGVWVNVHKNPRFKTVDLQDMGVIVELPRSIALASVAVRLLYVAHNHHNDDCTKELRGLGGELTIDLLALPPSPKHSRGWTMRQVTALVDSVYRLSYPISPAGADPTIAATQQMHSTNSSLASAQQDGPNQQHIQASNITPMGVSFPIPPYVVVLDPNDVRAAYWNQAEQAWQEDCISDVRLHGRNLSLNTTKLTTISLVQRRDKLLPYEGWSIRPAGQLDSAVIDLHTRQCEWYFGGPIQIEVGINGCTLLSPALDELAHLTGDQLPPTELLAHLCRSGLYVMPTKADAELAGTGSKVDELERFVCRDAALLAGSFMLCSSKWNSSIGSNDCLLRFAEVVDFDFCTRHDCERRFRKEREVYSVLYKPSGCATVDALDTHKQLSERLQWQMADGRDYFGKDAKRMRVEQDVEPLHFSPSVLIPLKSICSGEAQTRVHMTDAVFTENMRQIMLGLGLFSLVASPAAQYAAPQHASESDTPKEQQL